jgi:hypothetical protein
MAMSTNSIDIASWMPNTARMMAQSTNTNERIAAKLPLI